MKENKKSKLSLTLKDENEVRWRPNQFKFVFLLIVLFLFRQTQKKQTKKENEEPKFLLTKTNVISVMPIEETKMTENPEKKNKIAVVARKIAWYINPAIYVLFSVVYFIVGPYVWNVKCKQTKYVWH